jgi:hypothetical protein
LETFLRTINVSRHLPHKLAQPSPSFGGCRVIKSKQLTTSTLPQFKNFVRQLRSKTYDPQLRGREFESPSLLTKFWIMSFKRYEHKLSTYKNSYYCFPSQLNLIALLHYNQIKWRKEIDDIVSHMVSIGIKTPNPHDQKSHTYKQLK